MTIAEAIFLGILQGATEFLPVSSSGHLVLVPAILNMPPAGLTAVSIAHQGTLVAVLIYFFRDLAAIAKGVLSGLAEGSPLGNPEARLGWLIVLGSIPAAAVGLAFGEFFEDMFAAPLWTAVFLLGTAALLWTGERLRTGGKPLDEMTWLDTFLIGLFQMVALFPGISRSGSTIVGGLLRGFDRETAARYSFLLGVPAILGAGIFSLVDLLQEPLPAGGLTELLVIFLAAAVSGYACIAWLLRWLRTRSLIPFAVYCAAFGLLSLGLILFRG